MLFFESRHLNWTLAQRNYAAVFSKIQSGSCKIGIIAHWSIELTDSFDVFMSILDLYGSSKSNFIMLTERDLCK
jgi:hypothetical protein